MTSGDEIISAAVTVGALAAIRAAAADLRQFDFANHAFPWRPPLVNRSDDLAWPRAQETAYFRLWDGSKRLSGAEVLSLDEVFHADLTGDGVAEAIVTLREDSGGARCRYRTCIYRWDGNRPPGPLLIGVFESGECADRGLARLYVRAWSLYVELFDPAKAAGECGSAGILRLRLWWNGRSFVRKGEVERAPATSTSRRRVSR